MRDSTSERPEQGDGRSRRAKLLLRLAFGVVLAPLVLGARWGWGHTDQSSALVPTPDAIEYAAGAQSLVDSGRYYLQVGQVEAQPRYPPGWSFVLAGAVAVGVPAEQLWRVTTLIGVLTAWLLAVAAAELVWLLPLPASGPATAGSVPRSRTVAAAIGGSVAGLAWATSPMANLAGQLVMSDEPAVLATLVVVFGAVAVAADPRRRWLALLVGLAGGWLAITRLAAVALLALPLAVGLWPWLFRWSRRERWGNLVVATVGALIPIAAAVLVMARSGFPPFSLSAYAFWVPEWFADPPRAFSWSYAFAGNPETTIHGRPTEPHLRAALTWVLGLRGYPGWTYTVRFWPPLAWGVGVLLARRFRDEPRVRAAATAALLWGILFVAFFAGFFVAESRFFMPLGALAAVLLGVGAGWAAGRAHGAASRGVLAVALLGWLALAVACHLRALVGSGMPDPNLAARQAFADWRQWTPRQHRRGRPAFDPVRLQALGLLPCATVVEIGDWGRLSASEHVWRLRRALGLPPTADLEPPVRHPQAHDSWCGR